MSSFGPPITALHVLMMYATAGNLDTYLLTRSHSPNPAGPNDLSAGHIADADSLGQLPREERIKAFKKRRQSSVGQGQGQGQGGRRKREENRGVLMLGLEEIGKLFGDVVEGLAFLVCPLITNVRFWADSDCSTRAPFCTSISSARMYYSTGKRANSCKLSGSYLTGYL